MTSASTLNKYPAFAMLNSHVPEAKQWNVAINCQFASTAFVKTMLHGGAAAAAI
jgi:hypothetical protein